MSLRHVAALSVLLFSTPVGAQAPDALFAEVEQKTADVMPRVIEWRRDIHQHPELGNREVRTAKLVADHLRSLGIEVREGVAHTGVIGVLRGAQPGPVVALRADMDALPVTEEVDVPFASRVTTEFNGQTVGVMHACGHDTHVAMLMGAAQVLAGMKDDLRGSVIFIFQPAEEGPPAGEDGGAALLVAENALVDPKPDAVFGLHVFPFPVGEIHWKPGPLMASSDRLRIIVRGRQTHGALPWNGIDPIVVASQIVNGIQTVVSRQSNLLAGPAVVTIGRIQGGIRWNIIPDSVVMEGTVRTFDEEMRAAIHADLVQTAEHIAAASGATAVVEISHGIGVTASDPALVERVLPALERAGGKLAPAKVTTTAEDFSEYAAVAPTFFFFLGVTPPGTEPVPNHSPRFVVDEDALPVGVRAMSMLPIQYMYGTER